MATFTYTTNDANKLAGLNAAAAQAGKTAAQYIDSILNAALDSYAKQFGVTEPQTVEEWRTLKNTLVAQRDAAVAERDAKAAEIAKGRP